jgi:hypothetical protein
VKGCVAEGVALRDAVGVIETVDVAVDVKTDVLVGVDVNGGVAEGEAVPVSVVVFCGCL